MLGSPSGSSLVRVAMIFSRPGAVSKYFPAIAVCKYWTLIIPPCSFSCAWLGRKKELPQWLLRVDSPCLSQVSSGP